MTVVTICDYGAGNVRSVRRAIERLSGDARVSTDPNQVLGADLAVLPGVGSARSAMATLRENGIDEALRERVRLDRPVLGICLGLQLALEESEEDGGIEGLGILPGRAVRLREGRIPRMGWAPVEPGGAEYYFAHSYAAETAAATAMSEGIVAEAALGSFLGVQFHPEKSGPAGARYLEQCLSRA